MAEVHDRLTASRACNRDVNKNKPGAKQDCSNVVNICIFFDGTGNNRFVDAPLKRWSNPARLWQATQLINDPDTSNYPIYVSGVGTEFNGTATGWMDKNDIIFEDAYLGGATGAGGNRRIDAGRGAVNDSLQNALSVSCTKLEAKMKPYAENGKSKNIDQLTAALTANRLKTVINLSIFGFSRGAALARAFANDIVGDFKTGADGVQRYDGAPVRVTFLGLFDTVASFGIPSLNVDVPFFEKNLVVPDVVERCVHFVAAHELRFSFPVDLIRKKGKLNANWTEVTYPGVHSDVGGGYAPVDQKVTNNYARIPMRDMMGEAIKCGVRMASYRDIPGMGKGTFESMFEVAPATEDIYKRYKASIPAGLSIEESMAAHMKALYSTYGTMTRKKIKTPDLIAADTDGKKYGHGGIAYEAELLLDSKKYKEWSKTKQSKMQVLQMLGRQYSQTIRPEAWRLQAWQENAKDDVVNFISTCVHDSKAGFIHSVEPFSYFRPRGMAESSRNVLAQGLSWIGDAAVAVKNGVIKVFTYAANVAVEVWIDGVMISRKLYEIEKKFLIDTIQLGVKCSVIYYEVNKSIVLQAIKQGEKIAVFAADMATRAAKKAARGVEAGLWALGQTPTGPGYEK
jgi:hypothetical protein